MQNTQAIIKEESVEKEFITRFKVKNKVKVFYKAGFVTRVDITGRPDIDTDIVNDIYAKKSDREQICHIIGVDLIRDYFCQKKYIEQPISIHGLKMSGVDPSKVWTKFKLTCNSKYNLFVADRDGNLGAGALMSQLKEFIEKGKEGFERLPRKTLKKNGGRVLYFCNNNDINIMKFIEQEPELKPLFELKTLNDDTGTKYTKTHSLVDKKNKKTLTYEIPSWEKLLFLFEHTCIDYRKFDKTKLAQYAKGQKYFDAVYGEQCGMDNINRMRESDTGVTKQVHTSCQQTVAAVTTTSGIKRKHDDSGKNLIRKGIYAQALKKQKMETSATNQGEVDQSTNENLSADISEKQNESSQSPSFGGI